MVNIVEIVNKLPIGTKLYSTICGECTIKKIYKGLGFDVISKDGTTYNFSYDGRFDLNGECCIFPSKDNRDWNTFRPFKDGDILTYTSNHTTTFIYRNKDNEPHLSTSFYVACNDATSHNFLIYNKYTLIALNENCDVRLATEDEKIKLFDAIKVNGYKWNAETKTLEKLIAPKFKVGDRIKLNNSRFIYTITDLLKNRYRVTTNSCDLYEIEFERQDAYKLVPNHKFKVDGDKIKNRCGGATYRVIGIVEDGYEIDCFSSIPFSIEDSYELVPNKFDISTLKAYDKVLVRDDNNSAWINTFFGFYDTVTNKKYPFIAGSVNWAQCIPYEGNEHLLGTCDECNEYYENW